MARKNARTQREGALTLHARDMRMAMEADAVAPMSGDDPQQFDNLKAYTYRTAVVFHCTRGRVLLAIWPRHRNVMYEE